MAGVDAGGDGGLIPLEMFEAVTECEEQAKLDHWRYETHQRLNAARSNG